MIYEAHHTARLHFRNLLTGDYCTPTSLDTETGYFVGYIWLWNCLENVWESTFFSGDLPVDVIDQKTREVIDKARP